MNTLIELTLCEDGSCCCLTLRTKMAMIAILNSVVCLTEMLANKDEPCCEIRDCVLSIRDFFVTLFQMANMVLLLAAIIESPLLVQIYIWYSLTFVMMGFVISIIDFLSLYIKEDVLWSFLGFVCDVAFLFVVFRCLPLVDAYRKQCEDDSSITSLPTNEFIETKA